MFLHTHAPVCCIQYTVSVSAEPSGLIHRFSLQNQMFQLWFQDYNIFSRSQIVYFLPFNVMRKERENHPVELGLSFNYTVLEFLENPKIFF